METASARTKEAIAQIKRSATDGKLVAVIGTGVSLALTNGANLALSWKGLVDNGFEYGAMKGKISGAQKLSWQPQLVSDDIDDLLGAAEFMGRKLDAPNGDLYGRWLESVFKEVNPEKNEMARAVCALQTAGVPICTLNYDPLLERVTGLPGITFGEIAKVTSWMRRESQGILHLHGSWDAPATCILGIRDYETTVSDEVRDLIQRNLSSFSRLLFIGCGDTFVDPNLSALIKWLRERMKTAAPQHYALVNDAEEIRRHADPSWHGFVDPISYGPTHSDLAAFLLNHFSFEKRLEEHQSSISPSTELDLGIRCIDDYEPKPKIFGRDNEVETIVGSLLERKVVLIAGGPGMGKTAVATAALYDPRIVAQFGRRRIFASLETASEPRAILAKIVEALGLPPTGDEVSLLRILEATAAEKPFAAILDNAETVFDADRGASHRILSLLVQIKSLSLVVTIRGVAPPIADAIQIGDLSKLDLSATRDAFLAVAGNSLGSDPDLSYLLEAFDGHALSTRLIAAQAVGSISLSGLRESWDEAHAQILRISGEEESRLTSVRASLDLSLNSKRLKSTPLARRLISLLAFLPGGLAEADVRSLLGERGSLTQAKAHEAVICLRQLLLVESRPDRRLRMLTPLRECIKTEGLILESDKERLIERYLKLTAKASDINRKQWEEHRANVVAEADNLDVICELAVATNLNNRLLPDALFGLANFHIYSGYGTTISIENAAAQLRRGQPSIFAANCIFNLGEIAKARFDYKLARVRLNEAMLLYRRLNRPGGEANCVQRLGDIAFAHSDLKTARSSFEKTLKLYQKANDVGGQAHSIRNLGEIAFKESQYELARIHLDEALVLHQRVGDIVGEANYKQILGIIARAHSKFDEARFLLDEALLLTRRIGIALNEANSIQEIAHTERARGNDSEALIHYELALKLYRRANAFRGEAESIIRMGQIKRKDASTRKEGLVDIKTGFDLFFKMVDTEDMALPGWMATHHSLLSDDQTEAQTYQSRARSSWFAIGRLDLIRDWIDLA